MKLPPNEGAVRRTGDDGITESTPSQRRDGLIILIVANAIGLGVQISIVTLLICAILGVTGSILVILLAVLEVAFAASLAPLLV